MPEAKAKLDAHERNVSRRAKYHANLEVERAKERARARRRAANKPANESQKARHREAQARYREKNRLKLSTQCWQYRLSKKREVETQRDEEEFQALMALELDPEERLRIDAMHPYGASGSS